MKPRIRWSSTGCYGIPHRWRVEYGFFFSVFKTWQEALEFALALRYRYEATGR